MKTIIVVSPKVQTWADKQIARLSSAQFGDIYDQWFEGSLSWQDLYDDPLDATEKLALGRAANKRNQQP